MHKTLPPLALGRAEAAEIFDLLGYITKALEDLPYRAARPAIEFADAIREHIDGACAGGFSDLCEGCGSPLGIDEVAAHDAENGLSFCHVCYPTDAAGNEIDAGDVDVVDLAKAVAEGWVQWDGGECPLHPQAMVEITFPDRKTETGAATIFRWDWQFGGQAGGDIVAYRMVKPAPSNSAPPQSEEIQLLRQVFASDGGPIFARHSATRAIAQRLSNSGDALVYDAWIAGQPGTIRAIELTAQGKRRLEASQ